MTAPLFTIPGWGVGAGPLQSTAEALGATLRNLPGYGGTPLIKDFDAAADDIAATLPAGSTLIGWSLGGSLALNAAARHPGQFASIITIGSTACFVQRNGWPHAEDPKGLAAFTEAILADPQAMLPRFVGNFNRGDQHAKALTRRILDGIGPLAPLETLAAGLHWLAELDIRQRLPNISCPVMLMVGESDPLVPLPAAQAMAAAIPNATVKVMTGCAHAPFLSDPAGFAGHVRNFLA